MSVTTATVVSSMHPLTPLSETELEAANDTVRLALKELLPSDKYSPATVSFIETSLFEPINKQDVLAFEDKDIWLDFRPNLVSKNPIRLAEVVCIIDSTRETAVALVELSELRNANLLSASRTNSATADSAAANAANIVQPVGRKGVLKAKMRSLTVSHGKVQPAFSIEEYKLGGDIIRNYKPFQELCAQKGLDVDKVKIDSWAPGFFGEEDHPRKRLAWPLMYYQEHEFDNIYGRPLDGLEILVDLQKREVIKFEVIESRRDILLSLISKDPKMYYTDLDNVKDSNYWNYESETDNIGEEPETPMRPLDIVQPEGPSYSVEDNNISWLNWQIRVGFTPKEGVVLHLVTFLDRPVIYRASFAEMVVPYGDPSYPHFKKNAFDAGEDGLGRNAHSLTLSCDCKGLIYYFDAVVTDTAGFANVIENAICLHEEDDGIAWKHKNWRTEKSEVRRKRRLVLSFICTVANYEYGFYYHFFQDGTIEFCVKLTGIVSTGVVKLPKLDPKAGEEGRKDYESKLERIKYGTIMYRDEKTGLGLYAPIHQHFFCARIDFAIDGFQNRVIEVNVQREADMTKNVHYNAFYATKTILETEKAAMRDLNPSSARSWLVASTDTFNRTKQNTAYKIIPTATPVKPFAMDEAMFLRRAQFLKHDLWVTSYVNEKNETLRFPGGDFPNQNPNMGDGLLNWVKDAPESRPVMDKDVVVWYTFGVTHVVRLEDWPVMPVVELTFKIEPFGFCDASPVINLPRPEEGGDQSEVVSDCDCEDEEESEPPKSKL